MQVVGDVTGLARGQSALSTLPKAGSWRRAKNVLCGQRVGPNASSVQNYPITSCVPDSGRDVDPALEGFGQNGHHEGFGQNGHHQTLANSQKWNVDIETVVVVSR